MLFVVFATGGMAVSWLVLPFMPGRRSAHRVIRFVWRLLLRIFTWTRIITVDATQLKAVHGRIIVANHPSLIDVVILLALLPDVYSVAKKQLRVNPFIAVAVRKVMLSREDKILEDAAEVLRSGGNVLIFPEGTRTPLDGGKLKLHRGAAQLSVRLGVPVAPVRIEVSRRILAKHQSIFDMGEKTVRYKLVSGDEIVPPPGGVSYRTRAIAVNAEIARAIVPD